MTFSDLVTYSGRLHPLIVHLPIGFLFLAALADSLSHTVRYRYLRKLVPFTLLVGFLTAAIACVFGYILSLEGEYEPAHLSRHMFSGIWLALLTGLLYFLKTKPAVRIVRVPPVYFSMGMVGLLFLLGYTGHHGGSLTHGSDYLSLEALLQERRPVPASVEEAFIFEDVVHPLLLAKCEQCHGKGKIKGELSVRTYASLIEGGENGPAVIPGKLSESELYRRITLDPAHEEFMPTDGKTPLTNEETEIISWWIETAMAAEGERIAELDSVDKIKPQIAAVLGMGESPPREGNTSRTGRPPINPEIPVSVDMALLEDLRGRGLVVRVLFHDPVMLDITLPPQSGKDISEIEEALKAVAGNVVWLNLSDNGLTDKDLGFLKVLSNVEKLRLEKNSLSDGITDHLTGLKHLEALNLNETDITPAALKKLEALPALERIYVWRTAAEAVNETTPGAVNTFSP